MHLPEFDGNKYIEKYKVELSQTRDTLFQTQTMLESVIDELSSSQERVAELEAELEALKSSTESEPQSEPVKKK